MSSLNLNVLYGRTCYRADRKSTILISHHKDSGGSLLIFYSIHYRA